MSTDVVEQGDLMLYLDEDELAPSSGEEQALCQSWRKPWRAMNGMACAITTSYRSMTPMGQAEYRQGQLPGAQLPLYS